MIKYVEISKPDLLTFLMAEIVENSVPEITENEVKQLNNAIVPEIEYY